MVIKLIGSERAVEIVSNAALEKNIGRFVVMHDHDTYYTAIANLEGKTRSMRFNTIPKCINWLYQEKKRFEMMSEIKKHLPISQMGVIRNE